jgi:hypothetical protein
MHVVCANIFGANFLKSDKKETITWKKAKLSKLKKNDWNLNSYPADSSLVTKIFFQIAEVGKKL